MHDHNAIYCHETDYIGHGIYEDLSQTFINTHLQNIVNIGHPQNNDDADSFQEAYKEVYNVEQNEILQMNIESTIQRQKNGPVMGQGGLS